MFCVGYLLRTRVKVVRIYSKQIEENDYPNPIKPKGGNIVKQAVCSRAITLHHMIRDRANYSNMEQSFHADDILAFDRKYTKAYVSS